MGDDAAKKHRPAPVPPTRADPRAAGDEKNRPSAVGNGAAVAAQGALAPLKLRSVDDPELPVPLERLQELPDLPASGPHVVSRLPTSLDVAGHHFAGDAGPLLLWMEGGRLVGWLRPSEFPVGASRYRDWWLWSDGRHLEAGTRYPEQPETIRAQMHARISMRDKIFFGDDVDERQVERRASAGLELNRDIEAYLQRGLSLGAARAETFRVHRDLLFMLVQAYFTVFSAWASFEAAKPAIQSIGDSFGKRLGKGLRRAPGGGGTVGGEGENQAQKKGAAIGTAVKNQPRGKMAAICKEVSALKLPPAEAAEATVAAVQEGLGLRVVLKAMPDGSIVIGSVMPGEGRPVLVALPDGSVVQAWADIKVNLGDPHEPLVITNIRIGDR
jgi:hypothetical protein